MIACGPLDVVDVGADDVRGDLLEPIDVVEQADVVLELDVSEVVPITDPGVVFEVVLQVEHLALAGYVFVAGAGLNGEDDAVFLGLDDELFEGIDGATVVERGDFFALFDEVDFGLVVVGIEDLAISDHGGKAFGVFRGLERHGAHVKDEVVCLELRGDLQGLEGHVERATAIKGAMGGILVGIGGIDHDLDGGGKVVVDAGAGKFPSLVGLADAGELGDGHAVRELDVAESEVENFIDHGLAIGVAAIVPAGGEGKHGSDEWLRSYGSSSSIESVLFSEKYAEPSELCTSRTISPLGECLEKWAKSSAAVPRW